MILIGISLPGIGILEFIWLNNPLTMNDEAFGKIVNEALVKATQQIELNQDVRTLDEEDYVDFSNWNEEFNLPSSEKQINSEGRQNGTTHQPKLPGENLSMGYQPWNTRRTIDPARIRAIISEELDQIGINIAFNYAIFSNDSIMQTDFNKPLHPIWYKLKLFPDDIFSRDIYLGICFPGVLVYLRHNILLQVLPIIFTLFLFISFIIGILFIIRQKKLFLKKTDFINNMTHEFKTPITTIGIAADSIMDENVIKNEERVNYYANMIRKENKRMNEMVERILQVARLDRKELYFKFQKVNVHDLIKDAIQGISVQIEKRGGKIDTKFDAVNPIIATDPTHFTNLVHNLLDNANKYSPDAPEITVSTANNNNGLYMTVEDKGIGISKRVQSKIFGKFYRLTSGSLNNIKGFGIGLSYIKAILKINKGEIKVFSKPGKGSRFVVFIPFSVKQS
jgi:two-component system, OmpR family, phosphate regulon sensor histidine kinase PhoR